jgi:uncharacterized protein YyaL (SSP411 family)
MLLALDFYLGPVDEIAVVGEPGASDVHEALRLLRQGFRPRQVLAFRPTNEDATHLEGVIPLLAGKTGQGNVTVYICQDFSCQAPLIGFEELRKKVQVRVGRTLSDATSPGNSAT